MRAIAQGRLVWLVGAVVIGLAAALWFSGALAGLADWAMAGQRLFQNRIAATLRLLKQGDGGAALGLMSLCFAYGLLHAAGPGHGKFLISGYGFGTGARRSALMGLAVAAALAQALVAVALVYAGVALLALTRDQMVGMAEQGMAKAGAVAMVAIGLWLIWRGGRGLIGRKGGHSHDQGPHLPRENLYNQGPEHAHDDAHEHSNGQAHSHGPTAEDLARVATGRDAVMLVGAVAMRPCSGALILLVLTWQMGVGWAGVAGAFAMALGTASIGMVLAALAWAARGSLLRLAARLGWLRLAVPVVELAAGCAVLAYAIGLLV